MKTSKEIQNKIEQHELEIHEESNAGNDQEVMKLLGWQDILYSVKRGQIIDLKSQLKAEQLALEDYIQSQFLSDSLRVKGRIEALLWLMKET